MPNWWIEISLCFLSGYNSSKIRQKFMNNSPIHQFVINNPAVCLSTTCDKLPHPMPDNFLFHAHHQPIYLCLYLLLRIININLIFYVAELTLYWQYNSNAMTIQQYIDNTITIQQYIDNTITIQQYIDNTIAIQQYNDNTITIQWQYNNIMTIQ